VTCQPSGRSSTFSYGSSADSARWASGRPKHLETQTLTAIAREEGGLIQRRAAQLAREFEA